MIVWIYTLAATVIFCALKIHTVQEKNFTFSILEGDNATLPCILPPELSENNTVYWHYGTQTISEGENITTKGNKDRLSLQRTAILRNGRVVYAHYTLSLPVVTGYDADKIYLQVCNTARVTLYCNVTGRPSPTIQWYKRKPDGKLKYLKLNTESIFIPDVRHSNAGIYLCKVSNRHGQAGMEFHISVVDLVEELVTVRGPQEPYQRRPAKVMSSASAQYPSMQLFIYFHSYIIRLCFTHR
ncbi:protein ver-1-like [Ruditapes philippinarum]|uniref:protein ver-1-like n=1 Tax=Ruditapes philippinarum TaxID=129788 RepID=UPI00295A6730|nr:protein ver-1-like [Ruditapes philippinarum]